MEKEISELNPSDIQTRKIHHKFVLTMIDGKVLAALHDIGSMNCPVCHTRPAQMNNLKKIDQLDIDSSALTKGLSTLHLWIRAMEYCLNVASKLAIGKYKAMKKNGDDIVVEAAKKEIAKKNL
eukprot:Pompholyxophrys_punicea_v1_NODE_411_length_2028_cov_23.894070.p2 type:complete len:123 gc:universal NODE_411_length_2028_cov_23.894070:998-1366(+)